MTDDQTTRLPPGYRPRRSPVAGLPRIAEVDLPSAAELRRVREQLARKPKARPRGCR